MFDLDLGKMMLFGGVALVVIGPRELPAALRVAGRVVAQFRRVQADFRKGLDTLMTDVSLDRETAMINEAARLDLARNPATAMRGGASTAPAQVESVAAEYASSQMQAYLAEPVEATEEAG